MKNAAKFLEPVTEAAKLLDVKVHPVQLDTLAAILDKLSPQGFPGDVISKPDALARLNTMDATVEELDELFSVFPDHSGDVRYKLTATTLQWQWSSKHSSRYATITVPFPTILPMTITIDRYGDMDDARNHADECPDQIEETDDEDNDEREFHGECHCEPQIEQTASWTVKDWDPAVVTALRNALSCAVIEEVRTKRTFAAKKAKTGPIDDAPFPKESK